MCITFQAGYVANARTHALRSSDNNAEYALKCMKMISSNYSSEFFVAVYTIQFAADTERFIKLRHCLIQHIEIQIVIIHIKWA